MANLTELPIPLAVREASQAAELARIWIADGKQVVTLSNRTWSDPAAWGLMLADLARHVVKAHRFDGLDESEALARIRQGFEAEWSNPTDGNV